MKFGRLFRCARESGLRAAALAAAACAVAVPGWAQDAQRAESLRQALLDRVNLPEAQEDDADSGDAAGEEGGSEVILPKLRGLVLVSSQKAVKLTPAPAAAGVRNEVDDAPPALTGAVEGFLGQPLTLDLLADVNRAINRVYRENDRPVVDAYLPEQDISNGVVQIVVIEGRLGEIRVEGATQSKPDYLARQMRTQPGDRLRESDLAWNLDWLSDHPFREVTLVFEPGTEDGATDIVLRTRDAKPIRLHAGIDNTGLDSTGENQWNFGATWGRVFGTEHTAAYQYTTDLEFETLEAHSLFYRVPLPWRHRIDLLAAHVRSDLDFLVDGEDIGVGGESTLAAAEYVLPLRPRFFQLSRSQWSLGAEYKSTNSDVEFGGESVFDETAAVLQFNLGWEGARPDRFGATGLGLGLTWSPGDALGNNDDQSFGAQRGGATADYFYTELAVERLFKLPREWSLTLTGAGQWSNSRLISTEQLLAGGYRTVRGFDENLLRGDEGVLGSVELISPPVSLAGMFGRVADDDLHFVLFGDAAWLSAVDAAEGEADEEISSLGMELNYRVGANFSVFAGYGWHLSVDSVQDVDSDGRLHFGATVRF